jgi:hypothetical protein
MGPMGPKTSAVVVPPAVLAPEIATATFRELRFAETQDEEPGAQ